MNSTYWDNEGATQLFTHELFPGWLEDVPLETSVLDLGCGYGRITKQLYELGYKNIVGYDPSRSMIARATVENPGPRYTTTMDDVSRASYGLVICFALFTSCPEPEVQEELRDIIESHTQGSAHVYISDYITSLNPHYADKYEQRLLGIYGCFGSAETVVFRHHNEDHFRELFPGWRQIHARDLAGQTLSGNMITMSQFFYTKGKESIRSDCGARR